MLKFIETITPHRFDEMICSAKERIYLSLPNIHEEFAKTLINAKSTVDDIRIAIDISENNFRHGYGSIDAVEMLKTHGIKIFECCKNRVAFVICDEDAYFIFPESRIFAFEDIGSNAVKMDPFTQVHLIEYFFPTPKASVDKSQPELQQAIKKATDKYIHFVEETIEDIKKPKNEIKVTLLDSQKFETVKKEIKKIHPPIQICSDKFRFIPQKSSLLKWSLREPICSLKKSIFLLQPCPLKIKKLKRLLRPKCAFLLTWIPMTILKNFII